MLMTAIQNAIVIGGGIAGPVTALALAKAGIRATVHEAYEATDRSGAMLTVAPNGLAALETVGLRAAVEAVGNPLHAMVMEKGDGKTLMRVPSLPACRRAASCTAPTSSTRSAPAPGRRA